jgi:hypothetical protein
MEASLEKNQEEGGRILPLRKTADDWYVLEIDYHQVPGYSLKAATRGLTEDVIQAEFLRNWHAVTGARVFRTYRTEIHRSIEPLEFDPTKPLVVGWDFAWGGQSVPAIVPSQINMMGQWQIFPSLAPQVGSSIGAYEFCEQVADYLYREFALPYDLELKDLKMVHIGDPAGRNRIPRPGEKKNEAASWYDIMNRGLEVTLGVDDFGDPVIQKKPGWGWKCIPGAVNLTARLEAVKSRLSLILPGGWPGLVVDVRAIDIHTGFLGGYHFEEHGDGQFSREPKKDRMSDVFDALCYSATKLFAQPKIEAIEEEDEDTVRHTPYRSHASGRNW